MPLILPANTLSDSGYTIDNSLRMNDADNSYLNFTPSTDGDLDKWTLSMWVKRTIISTYDYTFTVADPSGNNTVIVLYADDGVRFEHYDGSQLGMLTTNRKLRDPTAWYHLVFVWDTSNGTAGNRQRMYINGVEETSFATDTNPSSGRVSFVSDASYVHWIGRGQSQTEANNFDGYLAEVAFCDGQTYAPSDFGETDDDSGIWKPKKLDVTFGSQGYYLEFKETGTSANSSGIGADTSGNGNHWAVTNLAATDITTDSPTNNWCIVHQQMGVDASAKFTFSEGNTVITHADNGNWRGTGSTFALTSGKWYWEVQNAASASNKFRCFIGVIDASIDINNDTSFNLPASTLWYNHNNGEINKDGSYTTADYGGGSSGSPIGVGDTLGVLLNMDDNQIGFYKNGSALVENYSLSTNISVAMPFFASDDSGDTFKINFGNPAHTISSGNADANGYGNFEFSVPSNYYSLCTKNLAEYG